MTAKIGERLEELVDLDFENPLGLKARQDLSVKLCDQFLVHLSDWIQICGNTKKEMEVEDVTLPTRKLLEDYLNGPLGESIAARNLKCNAVLPFDSSLPVPESAKTDISVVISFGFLNRVPNRRLFRKRINGLLCLLSAHLPEIFQLKEISDVEHNKHGRVPFLSFAVDNTRISIRCLIKPFGGQQFLAKDIVDEYRKFDDRFIVLADYFHEYLRMKIREKSEEPRAIAVIPKLCSIQMMFVHFFKHYDLLPTDLDDSLEDKMANMEVSAKKRSPSLATLFFLFIDYYLDVISLEEDFLEISTGESIQKNSIGLTNLNILSISDVFDDHLPGERVNDTLMLKRIMRASYNAILKHVNNRTGDVINDLRVIPLRPRNVEI